ncbi:MAG TPA: NAD(P)-dependent oxidoreductase [Candidatus Binatia bacterium]|jgi:phosphoglycerate dehydrogenase-like enzyme
MTTSRRPIIVVEDDPFLRLIQVILDPATPAARTAAFADFVAHDLPDFAGWCERLRARIGKLYPAEVRLVTDEAALGAALAGANVVVVEGFKIGPAEIAAAGGALKAVQKYGAITALIDRTACERAGVRVLTVRRRANIATAEHALALLLALARKLHQTANRISVEQLRAAGYEPTTYDRAHTANGNWARVRGLGTLSGRQLGIIGFGEIGRELALRAAALGMRIVHTQRHRLSEQEEQRHQTTYCALDELLAQSDCVSLHLPGGDATRGIIGRSELGIIKPGALLINVSQPQLIDRAALIDSLNSGRLGGFGLDVPYEEPGRTDDPLLGFPNVIVTPHLGASPRQNSLEDFEELLINLARAQGYI